MQYKAKNHAYTMLLSITKSHYYPITIDSGVGPLSNIYAITILLEEYKIP